MHCYWGGGRLSYMRFLTIKTFQKLNPDWQIILWTPQRPNMKNYWGTEPGHQRIDEKRFDDYFPMLRRMNITIAVQEFNDLHIPRYMNEVHKNDYIRINAMYLYGGLWSDMDIIYFRSVDQLVINNPQNADKDVVVCISPDYGHSTGFNLAVAESEFFRVLRDNLNREYSPGKYQCWGPDIYNKFWKILRSIPNGINLDMDVVYAHDCHHVHELLDGVNPRFTAGSIGCHWYGGNSMWGQYINVTRGGVENLPPCIITKLIKDAV